MNAAELQAFVESEKRKAVLVGAVLGIAGGFVLSRQMNPKGGFSSDLMWGFGLGVLGSAVANILTKHTGIA
jgi:ABC-type enterobactin transport system permease subunit